MQQNVPVRFKKWTKYFPVTLQPLLDTAAETLKCIPVHAREEI